MFNPSLLYVRAFSLILLLHTYTHTCVSLLKMNSSDNISFDFAHNQTSIDSNGTIKFDANRINLNLLESVAISAVWILLQTFGNGMLIGMILYEREGNGDPLKRRIIDQVMIILPLEGQERARGAEGTGEEERGQKGLQ